MNGPTRQLHRLGHRLWLDKVTRELLGPGTLDRYIREQCVTGLTLDPVSFEQAIGSTSTYDLAISRAMEKGMPVEEILFELAIADLTEAAGRLRPIHELSNGIDGWVSLDVSPVLAYNTAGTLAAAKSLFQQAACSNLMIRIPGTAEGLGAIENAVFAGIPVNVALLFSREQYLAAAEAFLRGIERRIEAGLTPNVASIASVFVNRWDTAVAGHALPDLRSTLGIAMARRIYHAHRRLLDSPRWQQASAAGARPQRLAWVGMESRGPAVPDLLYVTSLAVPGTISNLAESTFAALASSPGLAVFPTPEGDDCEEVLVRFAAAGIDTNALAEQLQREETIVLVDSWNSLLRLIASKPASLASR